MNKGKKKYDLTPPGVYIKEKIVEYSMGQSYELPYQELSSMLGKLYGRFIDGEMLNDAKVIVDLFKTSIMIEKMLSHPVNITVYIEHESLMFKPDDMYSACILMNRIIPASDFNKKYIEFKDGSVMMYSNGLYTHYGNEAVYKEKNPLSELKGMFSNLSRNFYEDL